MARLERLLPQLTLIDVVIFLGDPLPLGLSAIMLISYPVFTKLPNSPEIAVGAEESRASRDSLRHFWKSLMRRSLKGMNRNYYSWNRSNHRLSF